MQKLCLKVHREQGVGCVKSVIFALCDGIISDTVDIIRPELLLY